MNLSHLFLCIILACVSCCGIYAQTTTTTSAMSGSGSGSWTWAPPPPSVFCSPITTPKGTITFANFSQFAAFYPTLRQTGISEGTYPYTFSLCDPSFNVPGGKLCDPPSFLSQGSGTTPGCDVVFTTALGVGYNASLDRVQFKYASSSGQLSWLATLNCKCDESASTLTIPSGQYVAGQLPSGMITLTFEVASAGCCAGTPTTTVAPATTSAENICKPIYNIPGSIVPFLRPAALSGVFQNVTVEWDGATTLSKWQLNLCSPFNDAQGNVGFISEDNGQGSFPTPLASPSYDASTRSVKFSFSGQMNTVNMNSVVTCKCNPFSPSMSLPTNNIKVSQDPNSNLITAQIDVTSPECCLVPYSGTTPTPRRTTAPPMTTGFPTTAPTNAPTTAPSTAVPTPTPTTAFPTTNNVARSALITIYNDTATEECSPSAFIQNEMLYTNASVCSSFSVLNDDGITYTTYYYKVKCHADCGFRFQLFLDESCYVANLEIEGMTGVCYSFANRDFVLACPGCATPPPTTSMAKNNKHSIFHKMRKNNNRD